MVRVATLCCVGVWLGAAATWAAEKPRPTPLILDTDIGTEIDDALALGLVLTSPELELRGVTTVDGDAYTRALIVCRLLDVLERGKIPVASGAPPRKVPDFSGQMQYGLRPAHKRPVKESAVEFLAAQLKAAPGELTIVCIGPLTNIAGLLEKHPEAAKQIKRLVIMGGSIRTGYKGKAGGEPEWNILADKKAARSVFEAGVPIMLVPLDVTATLELNGDNARRFAAGSFTTLNRHLQSLHELSESHPPVLFDPAAVAACVDESLFRFADHRIEIADDGTTRIAAGRPNARVAESVRAEAFLELFVDRLTNPVLAAADVTEKMVIEIGGDGLFYLRGNRVNPDGLVPLLGRTAKGERVLKTLTFQVHPLAIGAWSERAKDLAGELKISDVRTIELPKPIDGEEAVVTRSFPHRVHVAENYETNIERRWWLAGKLETENVPPGSKRACRAVLCNDFDDLQGNKYAMYKAVIFNPVPGPPMGKHTRLRFRYYLKDPRGLQGLRVQIYTLSKGFHRQLTLRWPDKEQWTDATVDLTKARRPDGSGGPLSEDERIDDIQFYADPGAELLIDDIVLYDTDPEIVVAPGKQPFPKQIVFTGWFDTGKQGVEWPGDFEIVPHKPPLTWKGAKAVATPDGKSQWIRVDLRGPRPLPSETRLRFRYFVRGAKKIGVELGVAGEDRRTVPTSLDAREDAWTEADLDLTPAINRTIAERKPPAPFDARDIVFRAAGAKELLVDDVLLYEPGK